MSGHCPGCRGYHAPPGSMQPFPRCPGCLACAEKDAEIARLKADLKACAEALVGARPQHYYCDDSWYSCPLAEGGCADEREPVDECRCGADERNAKIDASLARPGVQAVLGSSPQQSR